MKKKGVTLVEMLLVMAVLSTGIFPLLASLSNITESALVQKDLLSAMTLGKLQMDRWLHQYQAVDFILGEGATEYRSFQVITPPVATQSFDPKTEAGAKLVDIFYNGSFFRVQSDFIYLNGDYGTKDLSTTQKVIYKINVKVWKIGNPITDEAQTTLENFIAEPPGFGKGDSPLYELSSLYSQVNRFKQI